MRNDLHFQPFLVFQWLASRNIAGLPSFLRVGSVAPGSRRFIVRVSAIVVVSKTRVWIVCFCSAVSLRPLLCPFLALFSWFGYLLRTSIVFLKTIPALRLSRTPGNRTVVPSLERVGSVAPSTTWLVVRVSAETVFAQAAIRVIFRRPAVLMWALLCPLHAAFSWNCFFNVTSVVFL